MTILSWVFFLFLGGYWGASCMWIVAAQGKRNSDVALARIRAAIAALERCVQRIRELVAALERAGRKVIGRSEQSRRGPSLER